MPPAFLPLFSAWAGPRSPSLLFIGEAFGAGEASLRQPLAGTSGKEHWRMLGQAFPDIWPEEHARVTDLHKFDLAWVRDREPWLAEIGAAFTNVLNRRPSQESNDISALCLTRDQLPKDYPYPPLRTSPKHLYLSPDYFPELDRLEEEIRQSKPNLIVAMGNTAAWALLQTTAISSIRGTTTLSIPRFGPRKVLPTLHPATVVYEGGFSHRPIIVADYMKAARESKFPEIRRPRRQILVSPTLEEVVEWASRTIENPPPLLACDTETSLGMIDTIGFASSIGGSNHADALVCMVGPHRVKIGSSFHYIYPVRDGKEMKSYFSYSEELEFWNQVDRLLSSPIPKVFQNGMYDLQYLLRMGFRPNNVIEDTMLAHHALFPEMQKGLGFLGSIYTDESSWKLMRKHRADTEKRDE